MVACHPAVASCSACNPSNNHVDTGIKHISCSTCNPSNNHVDIGIKHISYSAYNPSNNHVDTGLKHIAWPATCQSDNAAPKQYTGYSCCGTPLMTTSYIGHTLLNQVFREHIYVPVWRPECSLTTCLHQHMIVGYSMLRIVAPIVGQPYHCWAFTMARPCIFTSGLPLQHITWKSLILHTTTSMTQSNV
jgi:hypothetical protein